jgi:hypothetical protein
MGWAAEFLPSEMTPDRSGYKPIQKFYTAEKYEAYQSGNPSH